MPFATARAPLLMGLQIAYNFRMPRKVFVKAPSVEAPVHDDLMKAAYRRYASIYDAVFGAVLHPGRKAVIEALECRPGERVLEVGVGTGLSLPLYPAFTSIVGI